MKDLPHDVDDEDLGFTDTAMSDDTHIATRGKKWAGVIRLISGGAQPPSNSGEARRAMELKGGGVLLVLDLPPLAPTRGSFRWEDLSV